MNADRCPVSLIGDLTFDSNYLLRPLVAQETLRCWLSIHVDPGFLTGNLHHQGGFGFFFIALLILWPVLLWLEKSDNPRKAVDPAV